MKKLVMFAPVLLYLGKPSACTGQTAFSLDTTFRTVITRENVNSLALLPNGDLLLSGAVRFPGDFNTRLLSKVDGNGDQVVSFPYYAMGGGKLTKWNDRFYVAVGQTVQRVFPDGAFDLSFIGLDDSPYFMSSQGGAYHVYPDGRLLVCGRHLLSDSLRGFTGNYNLMWFTNTGYLDTTRIHRRGPGMVVKFMQLPDGGFICNGTADSFEGIGVDRIFKVDSLGVPDNSFTTGVYSGYAPAYLPLSNGSVYVGGAYQSSQTGADILRLVRFLPDGTIDPSFTLQNWDAGVLTSGVGAVVGKLIPWDNNRLLVLGTFQFVNGQPRNGICMLEEDGSLVDVFDGAGVGPFTFFNYTYGSVGDLLVDSLHGHIYIAGAYNGYNDGVINDTTQRFVTRLFLGDISTGVKQISNQKDNFSLYPNPARDHVLLRYDLGSSGNTAKAMVRDPSGRVVLEVPLSGYSGQQNVSISNLANGPYLIQYFSGSQLVHSERLVIQR